MNGLRDTLNHSIGDALAVLPSLELNLALDPAALVAGLLGTLALLAMAAWRRNRGRLGALARQVAALEDRLATTDGLLAEARESLARLQQRTEELALRQDGATARHGLRQAIALSRHGATARQIMDTCGLSQGEVHLIHTLYGRTTAGTPDAAVPAAH